jgi:GT2 family glycosyltransferase
MSAGTAEPRISAVVVNHDRSDLLELCLESLGAALSRVRGHTELIVVDNASSDRSRELVRTDFPGATLVALPENRGFAGGFSEGLGAARGEWVLTLNNDATVQPDAVNELLRAAEGAEGVFAVAAQLRFAGAEPIINSAGIGIDRLGISYDRLLGEDRAASELSPIEVFGASAGAALYNRAMLSALGGPDESFFAYLEDADLAWRARMRGWRSLYAPDAVAFHWHSATSGHNSPFKHFNVGRNRVRLLAKNATRRQLVIYGPAAVLYDVAYVVYAALADGTLAPLRGRLAGLGDWRMYRRLGAKGRRPVRLEAVRGVRGALRRRAAWTNNSSTPQLDRSPPA